MSEHESDLAEIRRSLKALEEAFTRLVLFEERQQTQKEAIGRAFSVLERLEARVAALEKAAPVQQRTTDMVDRVVWLVLAAAAGAVLSFVLVGRQQASGPALPQKAKAPLVILARGPE